MTKSDKNRIKKAIMIAPLLLIVSVMTALIVEFVQLEKKPEIKDFVSDNIKDSIIEVVPFVVGIVTSVILQIKQKI